jgi:4-amino-4-deoxy-L-arabinose transferase-like glycosyltransferase
LFLAICAPWFVAVSAANPEFAHFFFIQEHFQRFTTKMHGRYQPMWYFLPILAFGLAPWLLMLFPSLGRAFRKKSGDAFDPALFMGLWAGLVFVFFSVSDSKLPSYVLPIFPALALLTGRWLAENAPRRLLAAQAGLALLAGAGLMVLAANLDRIVDPSIAVYSKGYAPALAAAGALLALGALASAVAAWRSRLALSVALLAGASFACTLTALVGHRAYAPAFSIAPQAAALSLPPDARIFAVDAYDHTLPWYLGRTVTMVGYKDELGEAIGWEPQKFIPDLPGFARAWREAPNAVAVFSTDNFPQLQREAGVPMQVISAGTRYTIVRKP